MPITKEHLIRLEKIDAEDYGGIMRKTAKDLKSIGMIPTDKYLEDGIYALKQYYAIAMLDPANAHAVSSQVDPFWHAHILHTSQYFSFCEAVVGEYMHHVPLDHEQPQQVENVRALYSYTLDVLSRLFKYNSPLFWANDDSDSTLICWHKGNQDMYPDLQEIRMFEPDPRGVNYAFR